MSAWGLGTLSASARQSLLRLLDGNAYQWFAFEITSFSVITAYIVIHSPFREKSFPEQKSDGARGCRKCQTQTSPLSLLRHFGYSGADEVMARD
jgi:hypothetical protein